MVTAREACLLLAIAAPLVAAVAVALLGRHLGRRTSLVALAFPIAATAALLYLAMQLEPRERVVVEWPWIPSLGLKLSFLIDGLSVFFGLVVSGMGVLIFFYAHHYFGGHCAHPGRFYAYLLLFMAAMLGTVFSNHLLLLFVFWELTGIASFLLIGFEHGEEESRRGARMALLVTAATGLLLLVGVILLGQNTSTFALDQLLSQPGRFAGKEWFNAAFLFVALGAFGKSAQFPFHFWLPNAMAAPTPVSAYLHSATMVKLGVFLLARVLPIFQASDWWVPLLGYLGYGTMLLGAAFALLSHDLKAILAYSTVSQLGYLVGGYGVAKTSGIDYDYLHILNHVFYKGSLFMIVGIIDHATGTRDLRELGGLRRRMPLLGLVCLMATATMAGVIGTTGFISKEVMLKEIFAVMQTHGVLGGFATAAVVITSLIKVAFSCRIYWGVFHGPEPAGLATHLHAPSFGFKLAPLLLAAAAVLFGVLPQYLEGPLDLLSVSGVHSITATELAVWHGFTPEIALSLAVLVLGAGLFWFGQRTAWRWAEIPRALRLDSAFESGLAGLDRFARTFTRLTGADHPNAYLIILLTFVVASVGGCLGWLLSIQAWPFADLPAHGLNPLRGGIAILIALGALGAVFLKSWTAQLISLSISGFMVCFYFVLYRAPDLALTQILIETVTLVLVLYLLARFPKTAQLGVAEDRRSARRQWLKAGVAIGTGTVMGGLALLVSAQPHGDRMGGFFLQGTLPLAEGANAVNTILIDFRGFDTLGEITVLTIAMLGVLGLVMRHKRTPEQFREGPLGPPGYGIHHEDPPPPRAVPPARGGAGRTSRSFLFATVAKGLFFLLNLFALYLLLRGHNAPGGGFIAGLVTAISLIMLSLALGWEELHRVLRIDPVRLAVAGLLLAALTAAAPMLWGRRFFEHFMAHWQVPVLGAVHVGTPLLFDAGVFLVVIGITCKIIFVLGKSTEGLRALVADEEARYAATVEEPIEEERPRFETREENR